MLEWLAGHLGKNPEYSFLRVFQYISVRAGLSLTVSFLFCLLFGNSIIARLRGLQAIQYIRNDQGEGAISLAEMHSKKSGTPSMGGVMILGGILSAVILFGQLETPVLWIAVLTMLGYCFIGFLDDYLKAVKKNSAGLSERAKLLLQGAFGMIFGAVLVYGCPEVISYSSGSAEASGPGFILIPFLKDALIPLGILYVPFAMLVLTATSNAVNLTDGLDGLAAGVTISATLCFALVSYLAGRTDASDYLIIPHVQGAGELTVLLAALCGACFGFLWFNAHPAQVFMGDTGSMMLGGLLGAVALLIKQEFLLLIVGGIFVAEAVSVILQVGSYKLRKKRIFRMAPLHHHFERGGVPESKIIARFWIVSALLALAGLVTLKIR